MFELIKNIFKNPKDSFFELAKDSGPLYCFRWETSGNWETRVKAGLFRFWTRQKLSHPELKDEVEVEFAFNFVVPTGKSFNPVPLTKNLNFLTNILVKNLKIKGKSVINTLKEEELKLLKGLCQKLVMVYILNNQVVYQNAVKALCSQHSYAYEERVELSYHRYENLSKAWRVFRYASCPHIFDKSIEVPEHVFGC